MRGYATFQNLKDRFPDPIDESRQKYAETLLDDAAAVILDTVPDLAARLDTDTTGRLLARVIRVQCSMVARVLSNPNGLLQETIDDYTYRRDSATSTGRLYLADDEVNTLTSSSGRSSSAFTIRSR